jgi:molybdopterin-biosynthesis enzyme MoeA-like protein
MSIKSSPPVFIVGMPRSGTTLLSNLLNASEEIYFPQETHFFSQLNKFKKNEGKLKKTFEKFYLNKNEIYFKSWNLDINKIEELAGLNEKELFEDLICLLQKQNKKQFESWGEKTPIHFVYINEILKIYPKAKFVHIIRDPRDVFISMIASSWVKIFPFEEKISQYKISCQIHLSTSENICSVKYEDLVKEPEKNLKKIFSFTNLNYTDQILHNFNKDENLNFSEKFEPWKKNNKNSIDAKSMFKWKKKVDRPLNYYISNKLKTEILQLNYESLSNKVNFKYISFNFKTALGNIIIRFKKRL